MRGENAGVLDAMSDVSASDSSDSDVELLHVLDPSDPRAHETHKPLAVQPTRESKGKSGKASEKKTTRAGTGTSRWDSDSDIEAVSDPTADNEDVGERVVIVLDGDEEEEQQKEAAVSLSLADKSDVTPEDEELVPPPQKKTVTLSKWAQARFLVPASERKLPVLEEPPLEPLNDFILNDFGSRFRGSTGEVEVEKHVEVEAVEDESDAKDRLTVGAPLFESKTSQHQRLGSDGESESKDVATEKKKSDAPGRKRRENRYFVTDLATKCFNCGEVGHMSAVCMNDRVLKPCYYCALRGHMAWECPNLPCHYCLQVGHQARDCKNRQQEVEPCGICGRVGHDDQDCDDAASRGVTCMVCTEVGHLHCVPIPPPADRRVYCPHCAGGHTLDQCRSYVEPVSNFTVRSGGGREAQKCFVCQQTGHLAAACPSRSTGSRRVTGHKRGRDAEEQYPDYNEYAYDDEEDYYVNGGSRWSGKRIRGRNRKNGHDEDYGSRSRKSAKNHGNSYPRLNDALPTRPYRNHSGNGDRRHQYRR